MSVATVNPFDLLNETVSVKAVVKAVAVKPAATTTTTKTAGATKTAPTNAKGTTNKPVAEMNASINEKTPLRTTTTGHSRATPGTDRQERRKTDRHSRTGYKQDGEKKMTGGKGSWGKAVEEGEEHVSVDESVAIAEGDATETTTEATTETAEDSPVVPVVPQLTLAQYQATLKKPATTANVARKVTTSIPASAQILKKNSEVFVFPEIVKKPVVASASASKKAEKITVDLSKYISIKAVSSGDRVERSERAERSDRPQRSERSERTERTDRPQRTDRSGDRNSSARRSTNNSSTTTPSTAATKLNLKDDRAFPTLGSK